MKVLSFSLAISRHALCVSALTVALVVASCASTPAPEPVQAPEPVPVPLSVTEERPELVPPPPPPPPQAEPVEEKPAPEPVKKPFDPKAVSQEEYNRTKEDIQAFITNLNNIIRQRNFTAWLGDLSESYRESLESPANLAKYNRSPRLSSTGVELRNIQDFFNYVVVPSRSDENLGMVNHVDDIVFISETRVKAYTLNTQKQRLRLFDLERDGSGWKIIN